MNVKHILPLSFLLALTACGGYLDVQPQGLVLPKTDEEFTAILHNRIRDIEGGGDEYVIGNRETLLRLEGIADNLDANIKTGRLVAYVGETINSMQLQYAYYWEIVRDCNIVIANLKDRETEAARKALATAYAMKGILYFQMMREYCEPWQDGLAQQQLGLPIVEAFEIEARPVRSNLKQTADYALAQLNSSLSLGLQDPLYFFTEWVVKAYKAKLLFWTGQWAEAAAVCRDILDNSGYSLTEAADYAAVINADGAPKGEVIVRSHINNASELDWYFNAIKSYFASRPVSRALYDLYEEGDVRAAASFDSKRLNIKNTECKVRLSEMVLMLAECNAHLGQDEAALEQLNLLRSKRIVPAPAPLTMATLPPVREGNRIKVDARGNALTPLTQAILDERQKEFFMEGERWFDLKRCGRPEWWVISNGLKYTTQTYLYTAPIYKNDVLLNDEMNQNTGY